MQSIKITIFFILSGLVFQACQKTKNPEFYTIKSGQIYSEPKFEDPNAFQKINDAYPIVDSIFKDQMIKNHYPGIAYGIVFNGILVYSGGHGYSNLENKIPAAALSMFRIASMSKSFTAMAILKLRDAGKLNLTDPVVKYIPEMAKVGALTSDAPIINIQHLLTMSAGFPEDNPWGDRQLNDTDEDLLELISKGLSLSNVPGVNYEYSNLGYALLGKIITNVSGKPYQEYITENILIPLGMTKTKYEYSEVPEDKLASGYRWQDGQWIQEPLLHDGSYGAMGGMICSIDDFSKYVAFHLAAWPPRDGAEIGPVNRSTVREMHQPWRFNNLFMDAKDRLGNSCPTASGYGYGLGWRKDCKGIVRISHSGGLPGFGSEWRIYPEYGIGVISFSNRTYGAPSAANSIVLDTLVALANLKPRRLAPSELLNAKRKELLQQFKSWNPAEANLFAENFFLDESEQSWKNQIETILGKAGAIKGVSEINAENQLRGRFLMRCENEFVEVHFTLTPEADPKIQYLNLKILD